MTEIETRKAVNKNGCIKLINSDRHNCFGCSPKNDSGLQMEFYTNEKVDMVVSWFSVPSRFCGWSNVVHGGIVSTMLDEAMGWGGLVILKKLILSKTLNVEFKSPVFTDTGIRVEGSVLEVKGEKKAVMEGRIYDGNDNICAQSSSLVSLFTVESIRKMGVVDEGMLNDMDLITNFVSSIK
ncbi:MAG: PaaI family thioesterase [Deltaproteobacteria bacterium]|uniref:PaaI family thioesterase n=1 Tax=Candidatus Zymogenus saltonus TaxID=2844893 RepID=A0A9D8KBY9_9DELT|nr:PaaI family thioesterase [Candidatus Zymogenus saltonus]